MTPELGPDETALDHTPAREANEATASVPAGEPEPPVAPAAEEEPEDAQQVERDWMS